MNPVNISIIFFISFYVSIVNNKSYKSKRCKDRELIKSSTTPDQDTIREMDKNTKGLEVIKLEFILRLKIKRNDWLLADTCPQAANHCVLF